MGTSDTDGQPADLELPDDVVADLLSDDRRRYALETLSRRDSPMVIDDLAAVVRARETDTNQEDVEQAERQQVRDDFFQRHLPKLTATEVVRYNSMLGTVELVNPDPVSDALEET